MSTLLPGGSFPGRGALFSSPLGVFPGSVLELGVSATFELRAPIILRGGRSGPVLPGAGGRAACAELLQMLFVIFE